MASLSTPCVNGIKIIESTFAIFKGALYLYRGKIEKAHSVCFTVRAFFISFLKRFVLVLGKFNAAVCFFKFLYSFFDKLLDFFVFCSAFIFSDIGNFTKQKLRNSQSKTW